MSVLDRIFARKGNEVAEAKTQVSETDLRAQVADSGPTRGFAQALVNAPQRVALIAEVKKASPSKGIIRRDFDAVDVATAYERSGAHCLSVLTDVAGFQGSEENLRRARAATALPSLRKDFLYDPYQVWEARAWGADAILLIATSLETSQIVDLMGLAQSLGMDALVEVHDEADVERALAAKATLVGVNNRNLADFTTDLSATEHLLPLFPEDTIKVSESALETQTDIERVHRAGARAVLIGTTFCAAPDVESKVREVMAW
ncbi:indole-3-glycerol phosphate synthase TrpC [bacterium]|nr:MAG: indole-3-glycerol phosphate synthase TrpC [bacterium]